MTFAELVALMVLGTGEPDRSPGCCRGIPAPRTRTGRTRVAPRRPGTLASRPTGACWRSPARSTGGCAPRTTDAFGRAYPRANDPSPCARASPIGGLEPGGERPSFSRWDGTDFTRPTGPVTSTTFLGRDCWLVELAPPRHKPYPIQVSVDAATGLVLRSANREFGSVTEFTEVEIGADLPDELFVWDGPARSRVGVPRRAGRESRARPAARRAWLDAHGIVLELPVAPDVVLHEWSDDTGAFGASFSAQRRGHARAPRRRCRCRCRATLNYPHVYRWTDSRWDWALATTRPIADEQLALVKVQLGKST